MNIIQIDKIQIKDKLQQIEYTVDEYRAFFKITKDLRYILGRTEIISKRKKLQMTQNKKYQIKRNNKKSSLKKLEIK